MEPKIILLLKLI